MTWEDNSDINWSRMDLSSVEAAGECAMATPVRRHKVGTHRAYVPSPFTPIPQYDKMTDDELKVGIGDSDWLLRRP
mgnify:CR=1 FL=1